MVTTGAQRAPPADTNCPPAAQLKKAKCACNIYRTKDHQMCQFLKILFVMMKRLPHVKNQLPLPGSFFNQFVADIYTNTHVNRVLIVRML